MRTYKYKPLFCPKYFYFVLPKELYKKVTIPKHCGLIIAAKECKIVKQAPLLKPHRKLTTQEFYSLATKGSRK